jgi:hypothetical protein
VSGLYASAAHELLVHGEDRVVVVVLVEPVRQPVVVRVVVGGVPVAVGVFVGGGHGVAVVVLVELVRDPVPVGVEGQRGDLDRGRHRVAVVVFVEAVLRAVAVRVEAELAQVGQPVAVRVGARGIQAPRAGREVGAAQELLQVGQPVGVGVGGVVAGSLQLLVRVGQAVAVFVEDPVAVGVDAVADGLGRAWVDRGGRVVAVGRVVGPARPAARGCGLDHPVSAVGVVVGVHPAAAVPVTVLVPAVAHRLDRARADVGLAVVAVRGRGALAGVGAVDVAGPGGRGAAEGVAVGVLVAQLRPVAVRVDAVGWPLESGGGDGPVRVVAVGRVGGVADVGAAGCEPEHVDAEPVAVVVDEAQVVAVAVAVDPVGDPLRRPGSGRRVGVIAVHGGVEAVAVEVDGPGEGAQDPPDHGPYLVTSRASDSGGAPGPTE